jgi:hypothetical protein
VAEEVDVDRTLRALADEGQILARLLGVELRAGQRPKPAGFAHRHRHFRRAGAGHRRLQDGEVDAEQVQDATIMPAAHHRPPLCG